MTDTYLAVFLGNQTSPRWKDWQAMSPADQQAKAKEGIAAWHAWAQKHAGSIVEMGGPLGKTKKISAAGVADISNDMGGFTLVRAASHEAAAKMFHNHPHFAIFPGQRIDAMPVMSGPIG